MRTRKAPLSLRSLNPVFIISPPQEARAHTAHARVRACNYDNEPLHWCAHADSRDLPPLNDASRRLLYFFFPSRREYFAYRVHACSCADEVFWILGGCGLFELVTDRDCFSSDYVECF